MTQFARLEGCNVKVVAPVPYFPPVKITPRWHFSQIPRCESIEGITVYHPRYFMTPKVGMSFYGLTMFLSVLRTVAKIQQDFSFDLIDAHYVYPDGFAAVLLGQFFKRPVVVSARGSDINQFSTFPPIRRLLQYTLRRSNKIIAVCRALKDAMMQLGIQEEKISVIPNGVDPHKFHPFPKEEARRKLSLPQNKRIILSVGGLIPRKGVDLLIKALKILFEESHERDLLLVIVGDGPSHSNLRALAASLKLENSVHFAGVVAHHTLYHWYNAADLFCLASSREGWANVLLESLACGTPVVATDVWGTPEIVCSDQIGFLTKRDEREIAMTLARAFHQQWDTQAIIRYAREHTWSQVAYSVLNVFESAFSKSNIILSEQADSIQDTARELSRSR